MAGSRQKGLLMAFKLLVWPRRVGGESTVHISSRLFGPGFSSATAFNRNGEVPPDGAEAKPTSSEPLDRLQDSQRSHMLATAPSRGDALIFPERSAPSGWCDVLICCKRYCLFWVEGLQPIS